MKPIKLFATLALTLAVCLSLEAKPKIRIIATGGTIEASIKMIERLGGEVVKVLFLIELAGLKGRERLAGYDVSSLICYPGK